MKKILMGLCLLSLILIVGCSQGTEPLSYPDVDDVTCNKDNLGMKAKNDCNTCTCGEFSEGNYGWACTEIGCL
jgi:hypothetical protein